MYCVLHDNHGRWMRAPSGGSIVIDQTYVREHIGDLAKNADLSKFIL